MNHRLPTSDSLAIHRTDAPPAGQTNHEQLPPPRRPSLVFDDEKRRQYRELLRHGIPKGTAARLVGVAPRTVQWAVKNDPELSESVRQARLDSHARAAAQVARAGEKNWRAAAWLLEQGKRRRGAGWPRKPSSAFSDPVARQEMKQLVRNVLLEVMPELRKEIIAKRNAASPLAQAASAAVEAFTAERNARLSALAAEAKAIRQRGQSPDMDALWQKHFPGVPRHSSLFPPSSSDPLRNKTHPNAQSAPYTAEEPSSETNTAHQLATNTTETASPIIAQNP